MYGANNKIRVRNNYLYDNTLYLHASNDVFNDIIQPIDTNVINMSLSIPEVQNKLMYNIKPNFNLDNIYGNNKLKYTSSLLRTVLTQSIEDIEYYSRGNIQTMTLQYQKYFDKTIFNQIKKVIPSKCNLKHSIVYGNNDFVPLYICNNHNNIITDQVSKQDKYVLNLSIQSEVNNMQSVVILNKVISSEISNISSDILNITNIYNTYSSNDSLRQITDVYVTQRQYKVFNITEDDEPIIKYTTNYYKLVVSDPNLNKQPQIDIQ